MTTTTELPDALYFGCCDQSGHDFWQADRWRFDFYAAVAQLPWGKNIDGGLCPYANPTKVSSVPAKLQIEGLALRHYKAGWTAIAFWDRSVDHRPGSNSAFIIRGNHTFDRMIELARFHFPRTWERFSFEVVEAKQRVNAKVVKGAP